MDVKENVWILWCERADYKRLKVVHMSESRRLKERWY